MLGDEVRLRQVIGNLMSNALTHTPDGTPVDVRLSSGSSGRRRSRCPAPSVPAVLEVADQGPGSPPNQAEHVFERFYRADQARNRKSGGTGLGLAIVAALVAAHGGTAAVDSAPGQGATFRITLPLAPGAGGARRTGCRTRQVADQETLSSGPLTTARGSPSTRVRYRARYVSLRRGGLRPRARRGPRPAPRRGSAAPNRQTCTSSGCSWCSGTRARQPSGERGRLACRRG